MDFNRELDKLENLASKKSIPPRIRKNLLNQIKYLKENVDRQLINHPIAEKRLPTRKIYKHNIDMEQVETDKDLIDLHPELGNVRGKRYNPKQTADYKNIIDRPNKIKVKSQKIVRKHQPLTVLPSFKLVKDGKLMRTYRANYYHVNNVARDYYKVISQLETQIKEVIKEDMNKYKSIKVGLTLEVRFNKIGPASNNDNTNKKEVLTTQVQDALMKTSGDRIILNETKIDETVTLMMGEIISEADEFTYKASGWVYEAARAAELQISTYAPYRAETYIKTPERVPGKSVLNVINDDEECF